MSGEGPGQIRILHVITRLDCGGSAENTLVTALGTVGGRYAVDIICGRSDNPPSRNEDLAVAAGVRIFRVPDLARSVSPGKDFRALARLYRHMRSGRYDLVHTHTSKAGILGRVAAWPARVPAIVHTPHGHIFYGYFSPLVTRLFVLAERLCTWVTDATITLTEAEKRDYLARGIGSGATIHPVVSGLDLRPFLEAGARRATVRESLGIDAEAFVAVTVARLVSVKNHALIIDAAARLARGTPALRFLFVGDGPLRGPLEERVRALGLERTVVFAGWRSDTADLLAAGDVFVMVSKNEGMGRAFVEAQAAGLFVIGSRVGGIPEVMVEGETGYLVGGSDPGELAACIQRVYTERDALRVRARACREWVNPRFSDAVMVSKIEEIYRTVLERKSR